ncbi:MAG: ABC transporter permease, partial [Chloroflexi bacterium RBG_16_58_14]
MKAFYLALNYLRVGVMNEFQYRVNFFVQLGQSLVSLATGLIGLWLVFSHTEELNGWSKPELLAVMGVFTMMNGLIQSYIQPNMTRLLEEIRDGTLDFALTKPADAQVLASVREFRLWSLADVIVGLIVLIVAMNQYQGDVGIWQALGFLVALLCGGLLVYCFWLIITTTAFWVIRIDQIVNLFEGIYAAGRWPVGIYPNWLRFGLTFLVPVAFAVTIPASALLNRLNPTTLLGT